MVSSINSISASSIPVLFGSPKTAASATTASSLTLTTQPTGNTDDVFKAGSAIGKIIEIVAGMNQTSASSSIGMFTMDGAVRTEGRDGEWSMTKTGTGKVVSDAELEQNGIESKQKQAAGSGPEAEMAKAWLKAKSDGSMEAIDLSTKGVSATMTQTNYYNADGSDKGQKNSWSVTGLNEYLKANTNIDGDGMLRDNATGKYATIDLNGTNYSYIVF